MAELVLGVAGVKASVVPQCRPQRQLRQRSARGVLGNHSGSATCIIKMDSELGLATCIIKMDSELGLQPG